MENFSEMLGDITTCSIPFLDLPPQFHDSPEIRGRFTGYSEIFSGFSDKEFAINYQEFISGRSDSPNGRVQMEVMEFLDHSTEDAENVITDIICNDMTEKATCNSSLNDVEQEVTSPPSSTENSNPEGLYAKSVPVDDSSENVNNGDIIYTTVSSINLQTQPSIVPPPTKTPPKIIAEHYSTKFDIFKTSMVGTGAGLIKQTRNHQIQYKVGDSSCGNYIELDAQSAIAAMKVAMEQAQARLKHAKEIMERKRGNVRNHEQLGPRGNIKHDGRKELESKTSENEKIFNVEDECCVVKGAENQLRGQKNKLKSSQTDYKLEENSEGQKIEELNPELVRTNRSTLVNELSKHVDIENKPETSSNMNETTEMKSYDSNSKDGSATYREEMDNLLDDGNKNHTLKEIKQENNCSSKTLSNEVGLTNLSAFEEIPARDNVTKLDSLNVESLHVKPLDRGLVFEENLQYDKEDGIMHADRNDFTKRTVEIPESFNEELMSKNDVALDVNSLKDNSEELKPEVEGDKNIEREHEKVQTREVEDEEVRRERKNGFAGESKQAKTWERAKRTKNVARQKEHNKTQEKQLKAETLERQKIEKALKEAKLRAEHAAAERVAAEARERAVEKALADAKVREENLRKSSWGKKKKVNAAEEYLQKMASSSGVVYDAAFQNVEASTSSKKYSKSTFDDEVDPPLECKGTPERQHVEKVLAENNIHDILAQREQEERNKLAESLDACINRWSRGKEGNLRALLSTLQFILGPDSGWQSVTVTDVISAESLKRAYRKATLCVHPDKLQQRGANVQQKYICGKVFDLLKEAWDRFNLNE